MMKIEGIKFFTFYSCEGVHNGLQVSLCLILILCDVDGDDYVRFAGDENFLKEKLYFAMFEESMG